MRLKNIAVVAETDEPANLKLKKEDKIILAGREFEVENNRAKELLSIKVNDKPIVEKVKESKETPIENN